MSPLAKAAYIRRKRKGKCQNIKCPRPRIPGHYLCRFHLWRNSTHDGPVISAHACVDLKRETYYDPRKNRIRV